LERTIMTNVDGSFSLMIRPTATYSRWVLCAANLTASLIPVAPIPFGLPQWIPDVTRIITPGVEAIQYQENINQPTPFTVTKFSGTDIIDSRYPALLSGPVGAHFLFYGLGSNVTYNVTVTTFRNGEQALLPYDADTFKVNQRIVRSGEEVLQKLTELDQLLQTTFSQTSTPNGTLAFSILKQPGVSFWAIADITLVPVREVNVYAEDTNPLHDDAYPYFHNSEWMKNIITPSKSVKLADSNQSYIIPNSQMFRSFRLSGLRESSTYRLWFVGRPATAERNVELWHDNDKIFSWSPEKVGDDNFVWFFNRSSSLNIPKQKLALFETALVVRGTGLPLYWRWSEKVIMLGVMAQEVRAPPLALEDGPVIFSAVDSNVKKLLEMNDLQEGFRVIYDEFTINESGEEEPLEYMNANNVDLGKVSMSGLGSYFKYYDGQPLYLNDPSEQVISLDLDMDTKVFWVDGSKLNVVFTELPEMFKTQPFLLAVTSLNTSFVNLNSDRKPLPIEETNIGADQLVSTRGVGPYIMLGRGINTNSSIVNTWGRTEDVGRRSFLEQGWFVAPIGPNEDDLTVQLSHFPRRFTTPRPNFQEIRLQPLPITPEHIRTSPAFVGVNFGSLRKNWNNALGGQFSGVLMDDFERNQTNVSFSLQVSNIEAWKDTVTDESVDSRSMVPRGNNNDDLSSVYKNTYFSGAAQSTNANATVVVSNLKENQKYKVWLFSAAPRSHAEGLLQRVKSVTDDQEWLQSAEPGDLLVNTTLACPLRHIQDTGLPRIITSSAEGVIELEVTGRHIGLAGFAWQEMQETSAKILSDASASVEIEPVRAAAENLIAVPLTATDNPPHTGNKQKQKKNKAQHVKITNNFFL
jgi:hypothetical protein